MGFGFSGYPYPVPTIESPIVLDQPLPTTPPSTWPQREERCLWVLTNFTDGEQVKLLRALRAKWQYRDLWAIEHKEKAALSPKKDAKRWP